METNESLLNVSNPKEDAKKKKIIIIIASLCGIVLLCIAAILIIVFVIQKNEIKVKVTTIPFPDKFIFTKTPHYLPDNNIIFYYGLENSSDTFIGVMDDEGKNFHEIYHGNLINIYKSNGLRLMPFKDNKRVFLGDWILECEKNLSEASPETCKLRVVEYPKEILNLPNLQDVWSEMLIAPDNEHIAWTTLQGLDFAYNFIAKLDGNGENYKLTNIQVISSLNFVTKGEGDELIPHVIKGGEVKQFVNGGTKMTLAGTISHGFGFSMLQDLTSENLTALNPFESGYEETTILSPDEKLGIAMSTRFSPNSNLAILDLIPRPYSAYPLSKMTMYIYLFAVQAVREGTHKGNIGPVLYEVEKSLKDESYHGIALNDKEDEWAFASPMSWHSSSLKAIWPEIKKGSTERRLRKVTISNYKVGKIPEIQNTPDNITYAITLEEMLKTEKLREFDGKIKGKNKGDIHYKQTETETLFEYNDFSDDGENVYNGTEGFRRIEDYLGQYYANVTVEGKKKGNMLLQVTINTEGVMKFENDLSYGNATYGEDTLYVDNLK